jgi:magnesium-transporting ATPase (P-type)
MAEFPKHPFLLTIEETAQALGTDIDKGLTSQQVSQAQQKYPKNELDVGEGVAWYKILTKQVLNAMIIVSLRLPPPSSPRGSFCVSQFLRDTLR